MNDATIDEQIARALAQASALTSAGYVYDNEQLQQAMRDLLAGKFKEAPLPEIVPPPWPHKNLRAHPIYDGWQVECDGVDGFGEFHGPNRVCKLEAIEAWNAAFVHKDER